MHKGQFKCAAIQMNSGPGVADNLRRCHDLVKSASAQGAQIVVLPETFAAIGDNDQAQRSIAEELGQGTIQEAVAQMAKESAVWIIAGTIPIKEQDGKLSSASILLDDQGQSRALYRKIHLFDVSLEDGTKYCESETFSAGKEVVVADSPFARIGMAVCYDIRFPELFRRQSQSGMDLIVLPSAFTANTGAKHWNALLKARAIENQVWIVAANQCGSHAGSKKTYGHSAIISPDGSPIASLDGSCDGICIADIDLDTMHELRTRFPCLEHKVL